MKNENILVVASSNKGKIAEFKLLFKNSSFTRLLPQTSFNLPDAIEDGQSFVDNAIIKARHACSALHYPVIADDSGIVVHALNGMPGIYSARYAGEQRSWQDNMHKLLTEMEGIRDRRAYFHCALVLMFSHDMDNPIICEAKWHGSIVLEPRGDNGHGYDPVFLPNGMNQTAAELTNKEKNQISHRAKAMRLLVEKYNNNFTLS